MQHGVSLRRVARNGMWNAGANLIGMALAILVSVAIARVLQPTDTGNFGYVNWLISVLGLLANPGLTAAVTKYVAEFLGAGRSGSARQVGFSVLLVQAAFSIALVLAIAIWGRYVVPEAYQPFLPLVLVMLVLASVGSVFGAILAGCQEYGTLARATVATALLTAILQAIALAVGWGIVGLLLAGIVGSFASLVMLAVRAINSLQMSVWSSVIDTPTLKRMAPFAGGTAAIMLIDAVVWQRSEVFFLGMIGAPEQVAYYSLAFAWSTSLGKLAGSMSGVLLPAFSHVEQKTPELLGQICQRAIVYVSAVALPLGLGGAAIAGPTVRLVYGSAYVEMIPVVSILMVGGICGAIGGSVSSLLYGTGRQGLILKYGAALALLNIGLDLLLIPRFGAMGAAAANTAAQLGSLPMTIMVLPRLHGVSFPWSKVGRLVIASTACALVAYAIVSSTRFPDHIAVLAAILAGATTYGLLVIVFDTPPRAELRIVAAALLRRLGGTHRTAADWGDV